jgi:hypothetical protein
MPIIVMLRFAGAETGRWPRQNDGSAGEEQYVALRLPQPCQLQRQRALLRRIRWYVQKLRRGSHYTLQRAATLFVIAKVPKQVFGPLINDSPAVQILTRVLIF